MSDEHRPIEVVEVGKGSTTPAPGRPRRSATEVLLGLLVVGVFAGAACSAYTAWTVQGQREDQRRLQCAYFSAGDREQRRDYDDLMAFEQELADTFDCDLEGR